MPCCSNFFTALVMLGCTGYCPAEPEPGCPWWDPQEAWRLAAAVPSAEDMAALWKSYDEMVPRLSWSEKEFYMRNVVRRLQVQQACRALAQRAGETASHVFLVMLPIIAFHVFLTCRAWLWPETEGNREPGPPVDTM